MSYYERSLTVNSCPGPYNVFRDKGKCMLIGIECVLWWRGEEGWDIHNNCGQCMVPLSYYMGKQVSSGSAIRPQQMNGPTSQERGINDNSQPMRSKFCLMCGKPLDSIGACPDVSCVANKAK